MIRAAIRKEVSLLARDRAALLSLFVLPIIFMFAFGSMLRFGPDAGRPQRIAFWYAPGDVRGEAIANVLIATDGFVIQRAPSAEAVRARVASNDVIAGLVVTGGAEWIASPGSAGASSTAAGGAESIEIVMDQGAPVQVRGPIEGALTGIVARAAIATTAWTPSVVVRNPPGAGNPLARISSFQVAVPGNAVLFGFFLALTVAMAFTTERRTGTWRRMLAAPVSRSQVLVAMLVPYFLIGLVQMAVLFGVGIVAFDLQVAGSGPALLGVCAAVAFCAVALGLVFAALARSEKQLGGVGSVTLLVMGILGGCMVPRIVMPPVMQTLGLAVPHAWALDGFYAVLVRQSTTLADVMPAIGALGAFGIVFIALGLLAFRFE